MTQFKKGSWDFSKGVIAFSFFDPYIEKIFLTLIKKQALSQRNIEVIHGTEMTIPWIEEKLLTMDFFDLDRAYLVLGAESIKGEVWDWVKEKAVDLEKSMLLIYHQENASFKKMKGLKKEWPIISIEAPKFWENEKLFQFLSNIFGVQLAPQIRHYLLDNLQAEVGEYVHALKTISLHQSDKGLKLNEVKDLIGAQNVDPFEMAKILASGKWSQFLEKLIEAELPFEEYRSLLSFLQGHFLKIADDHYGEGKARLSGYDQEIIHAKKNWNETSLRNILRQLGEWEIQAKRKSVTLKLNILRSYYQTQA